MVDKSVRLNVKRQDTPQSPSDWEEFELRWRPGMNVISALRDIAMNPVDRHGKPTIPITYDSNCLEEVCGSCAMRINGRAAMACSSLVDKLEQPIRLEPLSRFPVVRDLSVNRAVLFENLKQIRAWVPMDGTYDLGPGPRIDPAVQEQAYPLSRCVLLSLHGSLPAVYGTNAIYGCGDHQPGTPVQSAPDRSSPAECTPQGDDGRRGNSRVQLRAELCTDLPEKHSSDDIHLQCVRPGDEASDRRSASTTGTHERTQPGHR